jgi:hypothetical protein
MVRREDRTLELVVRGTRLTWSRMNRRKADFKFAYKFLEDEV